MDFVSGMLPNRGTMASMAFDFLKPYLRPPVRALFEAGLRNSGTPFGTGFLAKLTEREREILGAVQGTVDASRRSRQAVEGRGPAPSSLMERLARIEERQMMARREEQPQKDVDQGFLRKEQFSNYVLNDILLSQLEPKDKMALFASFEEMHLEAEFGDRFGGLPYRHGSDSKLSDISRTILGKNNERFSSYDTLRLPYNLYVSNRSTTQLYLLATYVPRKYFMRPEVKMAALASLEDGEFYRIFEHIMCTIAKERIGDALLVLRHCMSRLEHLCRVHRSRKNESIQFDDAVLQEIVEGVTRAIAKRSTELRRRRSGELASELVKKSKGNAKRAPRSWGSFAAMVLGLLGLGTTFYSSGSGTGAGAASASGASAPIGLDASQLQGYADYAYSGYRFLSTAALGFGAVRFATEMVYGTKQTELASSALVTSRMGESGADMSMTNKKGDFEHALEGLNSYNKLLILERKIEIVTYAVSILVHNAEEKLKAKNIYSRNMY